MSNERSPRKLLMWFLTLLLILFFTVAGIEKLRGANHIVENFESALNAHFQHVKIVDGQAPDASAGFVLELDKDQRARRLVIRITDLSSQKTFDRVKIDFSKERSLAVQKEPGSVDTHMGLALDAAAAKIAGSG